jgi:hypothetical protein
MMDAVRTSETSVTAYQTTRRKNTEDRHLQDQSSIYFNTGNSFTLRVLFPEIDLEHESD